MSYYAVHIGFQPGIYNTWKECEAQTKGFSRPKFKKFKTFDAAEYFYRTGLSLKDGFVSGQGESHQQISNPSPTESFFNTQPAYRVSFEPEKQADQVPLSKDNSAIESKEDPWDYFSSDIEVEDIIPVNLEIPGDNKNSLGTPTSRQVNETCSGFMGSSNQQTDGVPVELNSFTTSFKRLASNLEIPRARFSKESPEVVFIIRSSFQSESYETAKGIDIFFGEGDLRNITQSHPREASKIQRGELLACIRALERADSEDHLEIHTDCEYLLNGVTLWIPKWVKQGWPSSGSIDVENADLFQTLYTHIQKHKAMIRWVDCSSHFENAKSN
ncbi:hypothetical protein DSO57_1037167 [Entomophthora muscae]|uniref:Uncharacterized protein n=1 Tax=Entomophthora muscae TaxID=34485 RepID=A0ACC2SNF2_9FUNG|nr:hypothetical protein DSO57_1037167 [Entomophthora muscae]